MLTFIAFAHVCITAPLAAPVETKTKKRDWRQRTSSACWELDSMRPGEEAEYRIIMNYQ